jgi:hypothetical protein
MKQITYSLLILFVFGCTEFKEDIQFIVQDYRTLNPENIITNLKIANIIVNEKEFNEMYANFNQEIEIKGELNIFKNNTTLLENVGVEVQIKGGLSRKYPLKTLGIKFNTPYNNKDRKLIDTKTLSFHSLDYIKAVRFRNSGNDFLDSRTLLKDISYTKLAIEAGLNLDVMYTEQTVVFINNVFLGIMNLRTESNTNGMASLYNVEKSEITLTKISGAGTVIKKDGNYNRIDNFIKAIENKDYNYIAKEIDIENFIDYMIYETYVANIDWPYNNVRFFAVGNNPFRFVLYDLDLVSGQHINEPPMFFIDNGYENHIKKLFYIMYANKDFKEAYDLRYTQLLNSSLLSSSNFNVIVDEYKENIQNLIPLHIEKYKIPKTFIDWNLRIKRMKDNFRTRENYIKDYVR